MGLPQGLEFGEAVVHEPGIVNIHACDVDRVRIVVDQLERRV